MKKWVLPSLLVVTLLILTIIIEQNWVTYKVTQQNTQTLLDMSIGIAGADLMYVDDYYHGRNPHHLDTRDVTNLIAHASGLMEGVAPSLQYLGVQHDWGVSALLQEYGTQLSHPQNYSLQTIEECKNYIHQVKVGLESTEIHGNMNLARLKIVLNQLYNAMSQTDREFYSA